MTHVANHVAAEETALNVLRRSFGAFVGNLPAALLLALTSAGTWLLLNWGLWQILHAPSWGWALFTLIMLHAVFIGTFCARTLEQRTTKLPWRNALLVSLKSCALIAAPALAIVAILVLQPVLWPVGVFDHLINRYGLTLIAAMWVGITFTALPARAVAHALHLGSFNLVRPLVRLAVMVPWLLLIEMPGYPVQTCQGECWGAFEGGILGWPLLGLHMFLATLSCAVLSATFVTSSEQSGRG